MRLPALPTRARQSRVLGLDVDVVLDRDLALARHCVLALDRALDRDLALDLGLDLALARNRARALALDRALDRDLARARAPARDRARALALDCARDLARALDRVRDLARDRDLDVILSLDDDLDAACDAGRRLVEMLEAGGREPADAAGAADRTMPAALAVRVTHGAVRVLPPGSRGRYDDEFASELYELAAAGASWRAQVMYAVRLVDRAWILRAELREAMLRRVRS